MRCRQGSTMARSDDFRQGWHRGDRRPRRRQRTIGAHGSFPRFPCSGHRPGGGGRDSPTRAWPFASDGHAAELGRSATGAWIRAKPLSAPPAPRFDTHQHCCHRSQRLRQESCVPHGASLVCSAPRLRPNHKLPLLVWNRTNLRRNANQSPPNAMQLATEREFCTRRPEAGIAAKGLISQSLWDFLCTLGAHVSDMSGTLRETESPAVSISWLVELRGFEPLTSAVRLQRSPI